MTLYEIVKIKPQVSAIFALLQHMAGITWGLKVCSYVT